MSLRTELQRHGVVPVATIEDIATAVPLAESLAAGGLPIIEVTMRTEAAVGAIERIAREVPTTLLGAGTVIGVSQARDAVDAGARFVVSPGLDPAVVEWCRSRDVPVLPGVMTPTELGAALGLGLDIVKFFPAGIAGGTAAIRSLATVVPDVGFVPTGGVSEENLTDYLAAPGVVACGGSWLADRTLAARRDFATIEDKARRARSVVERSRPSP